MPGGRARCVGRIGGGCEARGAAQLGVSAAIATLGLAEGVLSSAVATAIVAAALVSLVVCTLGVELLVRHELELAPAAGGRTA